MANSILTDPEYWDINWENLQLPAVFKKMKEMPQHNELLKAFDKYLPMGDGISALEVGGAPGQYLAYMKYNYSYDISVMDYSSVGCDKARENFKLLNMDGMVYQRDLFADNSDLPQFDVVYSLGLIEHFGDVDGIVHRHLELLKPGGTLLLGVPNFLGINHLFLRFLAPKLLAFHRLPTMNISSWRSFEKKFNLVKVFKGYVGGFTPDILRVQEEKNVITYVLIRVVNILRRIFNSDIPLFRKINSKYISGYAIGIYQKPLA